MPAHPRACRLMLVAGALALLAGCGDGGNEHGLRVETIAGGLALGDGGPATDTFLAAQDVAVDARGDVFVADANEVVGAGLVRRIDAESGTITTIGRPCASDDPAAAADGTCTRFVDALATRNGADLFIASVERRLLEVDVRRALLTPIAGRGDCPDIPGGTTPLDACLGRAGGLALDGAGNLYVADANVVRRLDAAGTRLTVIAGKTDVVGFGCREEPDPSGALAATAACLADPRDLAVDRDGNVFVAASDDLIRRIDRASGLITTVAGRRGDCLGDRGDGGPAALACFSRANGVAVADDGTVFVADRDRIRRIDPATAVVTTVAERPFVDHLAMAPDGSVVFAEFQRVSRLDVASGAITTVGGNGSYSACGEGGPTRDACLGRPTGIALAPDGTLFVVDGENARVLRIDPATGRVGRIAGGHIGFCGDGGPAIEACFQNLGNVVRDPDGNLYVADLGTEDQGGLGDVVGRVRRIDAASGIVTTVAGDCTEFGSTAARAACLLHPRSLLLDGKGHLFVGGQDGVHRIDLATDTIGDVVGGRTDALDCRADGIAAIDTCVNVADIALDDAGNLLVLDLDTSRIRRIDATTGVITTVAGNGTFTDCREVDGPATGTCLTSPSAMTLPPGGPLLVATAGVFRTVDLATGVLRTVADSPPDCVTSDPSPDRCVFPSDMELDDQGRLIVSELFTRRIRRVTLP